MRKTKAEAEQTRQHLLNAALEVFYRVGVTRASLNEIAQEAGVTRGALYWHFKNKEDLFAALFEQKHAIFVSLLNDDVLDETEDAWTHLRHSLHELLRVLSQDEQQRKFCSVMNLKCERTETNQTITELVLRYHASSRAQIIRAMKLSVQQGKLPVQTDIEAAALYLESSLVGLIIMWISEPERFDLSATAKRVIDTNMLILQNGLLNE
ncbi:TetR family transcriptional regulator [Kingella negevensis]|uniref:HTH-type transcriptional regulator MtrR n=1 Tax=Kingella negevensis TaxID=1522312 RepID=A0A238HEU4_9NEIS|nr:TetR family transcriptional regulator [Kingella negevensis]MDK4688632.1 TetR family transcriptional regulator [Kingella negevensis]MDK4696588.1 TetR family transcriptional regulator [Kingella negevensis]WII91623.1 TetR family transcriptional regulator [Kingella negevensis]SNB54496.1 HTH-type transcriptional regulator MtrR [Kingella negevensis]